jgi:hypothetical protein
MPQTVPTPTPGVAPTDIGGLTMQGYQVAANQNNAMMGGLFGIPTAILGGWARSPSGSQAINSWFA